MTEARFGGQTAEEPPPARYAAMVALSYDDAGKPIEGDPIPVADKQWAGQYRDRTDGEGRKMFALTTKKPKKVVEAETLLTDEESRLFR